MHNIELETGKNCIYYKTVVKVKQSHYRPGQALKGSKRLRLPDFKTIGI